MRLINYEESLEEKMSEFDIWITPSLGEIRDTPQFSVNLESIKHGFDIMSDLTSNFKSLENCTASYIARNTISLLENLNDEKTAENLNAIYGVLLLVTGKTDNNLKCQFPLYLRNVYELKNYPIKDKKGNWKKEDLPRVIKSETVTSIIMKSRGDRSFQEKFLESYVHLILSDKQYVRQLWSLGNSYYMQKELGNEYDFLSPIVIFQSRGSITATQGHIPENILRKLMTDWGLLEDSDYNSQDVEIGQIIGDIQADNKIKKENMTLYYPINPENMVQRYSFKVNFMQEIQEVFRIK